jgi:hypothetical protein
MIIVLTNRETEPADVSASRFFPRPRFREKVHPLADPKTSPQPSPLDKPERRWSESQLAAVVEAAYIRDALSR